MGATALVVHLASGVGGAERVLAYTLRALQEEGYRVNVDVLAVSDHVVRRLKDIFGEAGVDVSALKLAVYRIRYIHALPLTLQNHLWSIIYRLQRLWRVHDVEVFVNTKADESALATVRLAPKSLAYIHDPFLVTPVQCCSEHLLPLQRRLPRRIALRALRRFTDRGGLLLANSRFTAGLLEKYGGLHARVLYPPVDVDRFSSCPLWPRENFALCVGRISPTKELENCIYAVAHSQVKPELVLAGFLDEGMEWYRERLERLAEDRGVKLRILTNVPRNELVNLYCRAKVYLHPKRGEHFGISVAEALAAATIPVVPAYGGPSEFVPRDLVYESIREAGRIIDRIIELDGSGYIRIAGGLRQRSMVFHWRRFVAEFRFLLGGGDRRQL